MKRSMASGPSKLIPWAASSASWIFVRTARLPIGAGSEPRVPQKRINIASPPVRLRTARQLSAAIASAVVSKTCTTSEKRLIAKISLTIGVRAATARRPFVAFDCLEAISNARNPALEMYSTPEKSISTVVPAINPKQAVPGRRARIVIDAPYGVEDYDVAFALLADFHAHLREFPRPVMIAI